MTTKSHLLMCLALVAVAAPAQAEVIEVDSSGAFQRFDAPAVFTDHAVTPIARHKMVPSVGSGGSAVDRAIAEASRVHGVDRQLLEAVAWQESRGRMSAISPKGAAGVMQLMPGTAAELGVRRDNLSENVHGGAIYLRRQIERFGSVPLALAAYNAGPGAVARYSGIPPYRETRDYVARIMARWKPVKTAQALIQTALPAVTSSFIEVSN